MTSEHDDRNRIGRRQVLTLGAGIAAGAGALTAAPGESAAVPAEDHDHDDSGYRHTDHIRRYYARARF